jgi:hypothetical protein
MIPLPRYPNKTACVGIIRWSNVSLKPQKTEFYYRCIWFTKKGTQIAVGAWIEERYNRRR